MVTRRASKRDSIVEAAARLIRTEGVHAASISEIIAESGSSAGTIYHHFANKNEIVLAVARLTVVEPLSEVLARRDGEIMSPGDMLRMIVSTVIKGDVESALIVQLWAGSSMDPQLKDILREQLAGVRAEMVTMLQRWLREQGVPCAGDRAVTLAHVTMGLAMGLLAERTILPDLDKDAYVTQAVRLLDAAGRL